MTPQTFTPEFIREYIIAAHFNLDRVKATLSEHPELLNAAFQWGDDDFEDGLGAASHVGNRAIAEYYLEQGAPLTITAAAMLGRIDAVRAFLDADRLAANAVGAHRISVMFHAAMSGDTAIPELLLSYGGGEGIEGALHGAVAYNHIDMARWLLEHGVARNIDALNYESKTPLQVATGSSSAEMIALLRAHGAME